MLCFAKRNSGVQIGEDFELFYFYLSIFLNAIRHTLNAFFVLFLLFLVASKKKRSRMRLNFNIFKKNFAKF